MVLLQLLQLVHQLIKLGVRDLWTVEHVIAVLVVPDGVAEFPQPL
jgi:hypothetical protein